MAKASLEKSLISYSILISLIININFKFFFIINVQTYIFALKLDYKYSKKKKNLGWVQGNQHKEVLNNNNFYPTMRSFNNSQIKILDFCNINKLKNNSC